MRNLIIALFFLCALDGVSQGGFYKPSYIRWPDDTTKFAFLVMDTVTKRGTWFEFGSGFEVADGTVSVAGGETDSVFVMGDSLCAISMGDTTCVSNDSVYITVDSFCYIVNGDTTCVEFGGGLDGTNIYNTSDTITQGENRVVTIPGASTLGINEAGSSFFFKCYPNGDSTVFTKALKIRGQLLDNYASPGTSGQFLKSIATGVDWESPTVRLNEITAANLQSGAVDHTNKYIDWQWNTVGAATGIRLSTTSTQQGVGPSQKLLEVSMSGAHAYIDKTSVAAYFSNSHSGPGSPINFGAFGHASGATINYGVFGDATSGMGVYGAATSGVGLTGYATSGLAFEATNDNANTNTVEVLVDLDRRTSGTPANGLGGAITFTGETSTSNRVSNTLSSLWTGITDATRTSNFTLSGVTSAITSTLLEMPGTGRLKLNKFGVGTFTGTPAYTLQVDASGNLIEGTTSSVDHDWYESGGTAPNAITDAMYHTGPAHIGDATMSQTGAFNVQGLMKMRTTSTNSSMFLGGGNLTLTGTDNIGIGVSAGEDITSGSYNILLGFRAGRNITANTNGNIIIGREAGDALTTGANNVVIGGQAAVTNDYAGAVVIGYQAGISADVDSSTIIGYLAGKGFSNGGHRGNTILGYYAGSEMQGSGNIYIGKRAGYGLGASNRLVIDNNISTTPFITGDMSADTLRINATTRFNGRTQQQQGVDVASVAGAIILGGNGNSFEITGTNAITLISNLSWQNGSLVNLIFTSTATLTNGTATSGTDITLKLAGGANFVATSDDIVTLMLCEVGGTQAWREISRSVN